MPLYTDIRPTMMHNLGFILVKTSCPEQVDRSFLRKSILLVLISLLLLLWRFWSDSIRNVLIHTQNGWIRHATKAVAFVSTITKSCILYHNISVPARHWNSKCRTDAAATIASRWSGLVVAGPLAGCYSSAFSGWRGTSPIPQALRPNWMPYTSVCRVLASMWWLMDWWRDKKCR